MLVSTMKKNTLYKTWFTLPVCTGVSIDSQYSEPNCTDIPTHGMVEYTIKPVCTIHTGFLLDWYVPTISDGTPWYNEPIKYKRKLSFWVGCLEQTKGKNIKRVNRNHVKGKTPDYYSERKWRTCRVDCRILYCGSTWWPYHAFPDTTSSYPNS